MFDKRMRMAVLMCLFCAAAGGMEIGTNVRDVNRKR
jgi:hypothetical protein